LLIPSAALLWGVQFAFLNPALALAAGDALQRHPGQVGTVLVVCRVAGP
jgi:SET family sugar efflux transporter-like MFS transporter